MHARSTLLYRLFFALKPHPVIARQTDHFAEGLAGDVQRIRPEHQHLTLAITPDYEAYPYEAIKALIRAGTAIMADPFDLRLDHLNISNRLVVLRPSRAVPPLNGLQHAIRQAMGRAGVTSRPDWTFNPHQTLFYREGRPEQRPIEGFCWHVDAFVLICSHVGRTRHDILATWPLRGCAQLSLF